MQCLSACSQASKTDLCFLKCRLCCEVCAEKTRVNSYTILAVQRQTSRSKVVNWVKQHIGFTSWFLVSGGTWSKREAGAWFPFSAVSWVYRLCFYVMVLSLCFRGNALLNRVSPERVLVVPVWSRLEFSQLRNKKQSRTSQMLPLPQQCFSEAKCLSNNGILTLAAISLSSNFFASFLQPICCSWYCEALPLWQTGEQ